MEFEGMLDQLKTSARSVSKAAYCPYSHFAVGAALATASGKIFTGCNVENVSFGLTICAERNAIFQAVAAGERIIEMIVIYTPTSLASSPCGACRQVIWEFGRDSMVHCFCDGPQVISARANELLAYGFGPEALQGLKNS
jgi:cytidine deaminase